ncbi:MAG TPA: nitroreductase family deazaflavin-dependent oxidoreductase [Candidatus Acidoferrales bacterium]|nr:nitroreductase family deazaflavin-dependent oxidoreductase [Candidatus Acidoferrales bacterium]
MASDWNNKIIEQFRANEGRVGPPFAGSTVALLHHRGRKTGTEYVNPVLYLASDDDDKVMYIFATKRGEPDNPAWYRNLVAAGAAEVEVGTETFPVSVREVTGPDRDRVYAEQVLRVPTFGDYETKTAGVRTIPVLELRRS